MNKVIKQIIEILSDNTSGYMTDDERKEVTLYSEWREKVVKENIHSRVVTFMASDEYRNARGFKKLRYIWIYNVVLDTRGGVYLPEHEIEALARCFLPDILAFFESEEGKAEFAAWKAEQEKKSSLAGCKKDEKVQLDTNEKSEQ